MDNENSFYVKFFAPNGLSQIDKYLHLCEMNLSSYLSNFNNKIILRNQTEEDRFDWAMDSSTDDFLVATGTLFLNFDESWILIKSLSMMLDKAGYPHYIGLDNDLTGDFSTISHEWDERY